MIFLTSRVLPVVCNWKVRMPASSLVSSISRLRRYGFLSLIIIVPGLAAAQVEPPFDATADTVFDIIRQDDPTQFVCLTYEGRETRQMWDKRLDGESDLNVYLFRAYFEQGPSIDIILNPEFTNPETARAEAMRYTRGLGQLPLVFRQGIKQFGIHKGNKSFHAGPGKIFMYQDKTSLRIKQKHLEESLMHEATHASLDRKHALSAPWLAAQASDKGFVTRYAARRPEGEDLAETALFAFGLLRHPGRIPPADSKAILARIPARIAVVRDILDNGPQLAPAPTPPDNCN